MQIIERAICNMFKEIIRENYTVEVEEAELYVNNEARGRSG